MNHTFTTELNLLKAKSNYLRHLFNTLSGEKLRQVLISPPDELVQKLKKMGLGVPDAS